MDAETQKEIKELLSVLKNKGVKACEGDEDFTTIISWDDLDRIRRALDGVKSKIVIRPRLGYDNGTIIYLSK